jgi:hypothetical protein
MDYLSIVRAPRPRRPEAALAALMRARVVRPARSSQQALLFKQEGLSAYRQTRLFFRYTKRLT